MIAVQLKKMFDPFVCLNIQVWENFEKLGIVNHFSKETVLKASNTKEKYLNIILKGSGGNLIWNKSNFVCIDIAFDNEFLFDFMSFTLQKPTPIEVRLFEDATIFRISHQNFQQTLVNGNFGEKITRLIAEASFIDKQQQQIDLLTKTAKERYVEQLQIRKGIEKMPLKYLASYLGITPQSLSRIRAEKIKELPNDNY
jgi:signal-transduction protein with cAMP-binding, CBS, and nucleotidyltransferase domain